MSIKDYVRKYLPSSIAVMMWEDPELEIYSVWDQEPNTGGVAIPPQPVRWQVEMQSRLNGQPEELSQLRKKVGSLEVMLQKMSLEREPTLEPEEEDIESFLKRMAAEYVQTRKDPITKKRSGF